ncbi:MAG: AMP-binding protein, partial [Pseudomonadales bacterium]|nr:AMP-binding protein [Pseudomonadales bacterium]
AAPIAAETHEALLGIGLPICEMWGMSECAAATVNPSDSVRIGTVGRPLPGVEIKLAEDGELLVRGPMLMKGYRSDPAKTAEAIDDEGWLHSGDIATIDDDGYVKIVDRKKDIIINSAGKNMSPSHIESAVKVDCPLAGYVVAIGDNRSYVTALINLDAAACSVYLAQAGVTDTSAGDLATHPAIRKAMDEGIAAANSKLARVEQIKRYLVVNDRWEPRG